MTSSGRREKHEEAVSQLRSLLKRAQGATAPAWLELDLSMGQLRTLFALRACGTTSLGPLADCLGIGAPTASVVVEQLVQLGLVDRSVDAADRRRLVLCVSDRGDELLARLRQGRRRVIETWLEGLDDSELEDLCCSLPPLLRSMAAADDKHGSASSAETEATSPP